MDRIRDSSHLHLYHPQQPQTMHQIRRQISLNALLIEPTPALVHAQLLHALVNQLYKTSLPIGGRTHFTSGQHNLLHRQGEGRRGLVHQVTLGVSQRWQRRHRRRSDRAGNWDMDFTRQGRRGGRRGRAQLMRIRRVGVASSETRGNALEEAPHAVVGWLGERPKEEAISKIDRLRQARYCVSPRTRVNVCASWRRELVTATRFFAGLSWFCGTAENSSLS